MGAEAGGDRTPAIGDYGFISDCHSPALISRSGSIDWCCMPRIDSGSCFGRLLGWDSGGYCQIAPASPFRSSRRYLDDSLVLETTFTTDAGVARLLDCVTLTRGGQRRPHRQILRILEGVEGEIPFQVEICPRFDYGAIRPWIRGGRDGGFTAVGGETGLLLSGDFPLSPRGRHDLVARCALSAGGRKRLSILFRRPEELEGSSVPVPDIPELDRRLEETLRWWKSWSSQSTSKGAYAAPALRSAVVLKGLTNAPTGAIAAAPTTSLPEAPGGGRNWDYRFTWVRDSSFTARSLAELGFHKEADGFRRFIERAAAGSADELQILFGVGGERRLHEHPVKELTGYRGAKPVRMGNAAEGQTQLDVYGELMDLAWRWHLRGRSPDEDYWEFLTGLVEAAARRWRRPDRGIWEMRGAPRHFVHSKAMCWAALDRGIRLAEALGRPAPLDRWRRVRDEIRRTVEEKGYHPGRGVFVQAFDHPVMDAALLLLPATGFVEHGDERMIRTVDAVREDLEEGGLVRRYAAGNDGMEGREGTFLACTFWLAECLAHQGRLEEAHGAFRRALATGNDLGLFAEEYDPVSGEMLGNFPQALTHLSLITAAVALAEGG